MGDVAVRDGDFICNVCDMACFISCSVQWPRWLCAMDTIIQKMSMLSSLLQV